MTDLHQILASGDKLGKDLNIAYVDLVKQVTAAATAERDYRKEKALKYVQARSMEELKLAAERQAWVDAETADLRMTRDIAEGVQDATKQLIQNLRQQLSHVQTTANLLKSERDFYQMRQDGSA